MTLVLSPCGGFGNRIRSLCGGVILAKELGLTIEHLWDGGDYKTAKYFSAHLDHLQYVHDVGFEHFFEPRLPRYSGKLYQNIIMNWRRIMAGLNIRIMLIGN